MNTNSNSKNLSDEDIFAGTGDVPHAPLARRVSKIRATKFARVFAAWADKTPFARYYLGLHKMANKSSGRNDEEEAAEQMASVKWFAVTYPQYQGCLQASVGDALMSPGLRGKAVSRGYVPGTSDFFLAVAKRGYFGDFIEMKKDTGSGGTVSEEQFLFLESMKQRGYRVRVVHGFREFHEEVEWYFAGEDTQHYVNQK